MTGTPKPVQASGGSSPWSCTAVRPHSRTLARMTSGDSLTKTPTTAPSAGRVRASAAAVAGSTYRGERG